MRVVASGYYHGSMEGAATPFHAGEEREVPEATALYLLATFPGLFAAPVVAAVVPAPVLDRKVQTPPRRK